MRTALLLVCTAFAAACGGEGGGITPPPPPPPPAETVSVRIVNPIDGLVVSGTNSTISVSAIAQSTKIAIPEGNVTWTHNGNKVASGRNASITLALGPNTLCVKADGQEKSAEQCVFFTFSPSFSCKIVVASSETESIGGASLRLVLSKNGKSAEMAVGQDGSCSYSGALALEDSVKFVLDDMSSPRRLHPMIGYASKADLAKGLVLVAVPREWKILTGSFAGQVVPIDLNLAYVKSSNGAGSSFYNRNPQNGGWFYSVVSFSSSVLPQPTAVRNDLSKSGQSIDSNAEAGIWADIDRLEQALGWDILRPAAASEVKLPPGVALMADSTAQNGSWTAMGGNIAQGIELAGGRITYKGIPATSIVGVTAHETIHVLGFGHGCGWKGLMSDGCGYSRPNTTVREDVAYIQLMYRVRDLERKHNTRFSIGESHIGQEVIMMNLAEKRLVK